MSVWKYKQLSPYLAAKRTKLLSKNELYELAERNITFLVTKLMDTPYRKEIDAMYTQRADIINLEDALLTHFTNSCKKVAGMAPKNVETVVHKYLNKFEIDALKSLIKVMYAKIDLTDAFKYVIPAGRFDKSRCEAILTNAKNLRDLIELTVDTGYSYIMWKNLPIVEETGLIFLLESELNKHYYDELWRDSLKVRGLDGRIIRESVGLEITSMNVKTIMRYQLAGFRKESIMNYLVVINEILDEQTLDKAIQTSNITDMIEVFNEASEDMGYDYRYMFKAMNNEYTTSKTVSRLEYVLEKSILESNLRMMKRYTPYFNAASLLAYIHAKWYELRNIRSIMNGVSRGLTADQIKEELIIV